ncbi:uncharacterized protein BDV17DRAFT_87499 [Aspergillus undulatus]|uniref:uncharacterized protein n=1 Tax=Aspergillus undulatus TaxID=1810928 RepID=UPI003CCE4161
MQYLSAAICGRSDLPLPRSKERPLCMESASNRAPAGLRPSHLPHLLVQYRVAPTRERGDRFVRRASHLPPLSVYHLDISKGSKNRPTTSYKLGALRITFVRLNVCNRYRVSSEDGGYITTGTVGCVLCMRSEVWTRRDGDRSLLRVAILS